MGLKIMACLLKHCHRNQSYKSVWKISGYNCLTFSLCRKFEWNIVMIKIPTKLNNQDTFVYKNSKTKNCY